MRPTTAFLLLVICIWPLQVWGLEPFTTDGCSGFPDGTIYDHNLWYDCCVEHDLAYWQGGTYDQRLAADQALKVCVEETGQPFVAEVMLGGVRAGGSPFFPTTYRWGYGWKYLRGYAPLTTDEQELVEQMLRKGRK